MTVQALWQQHRDDQHRSDVQRNVLTLTISDTGVGMPADYNPSKTSGLGMRVIDTLVRQMNGSLLHPAAGGSARFEVSVPLAL